jgi:hypothetical protein
MRLPKLLPNQLTQFMERPAIVRFFARWSIGVGAFAVLFILAMAIGHFVFGMPINDADTGEPLTPEKALGIFILLGGAGAFFVIDGARRLRRMRDHG